VKKIGLKVTYHDPCRLGRLGEPYIHWQGEKIPGHRFMFDPPKTYRRGTNGIYNPPEKSSRGSPASNLRKWTGLKNMPGAAELEVE